MADFTIGKISHSTNSSGDMYAVSSSLSQTSQFQRLATNPQERDFFEKSLKAKQLEALANNDEGMHNLIGSLLNAINLSKKSTTEKPQSEHKFDSNNYFGF